MSSLLQQRKNTHVNVVSQGLGGDAIVSAVQLRGRGQSWSPMVASPPPSPILSPPPPSSPPPLLGSNTTSNTSGNTSGTVKGTGPQTPAAPVPPTVMVNGWGGTWQMNQMPPLPIDIQITGRNSNTVVRPSYCPEALRSAPVHSLK